MHQARAGRGVVGGEPEGGVTEPQVQHDPAVADRHIAAAVTVDAVRGVAEPGMLDHAEQVHRHQAQRGHRDSCAAAAAASGSGCSQLARLASGSSTSQNASDGPLASVLGPGPWPNSMHWPVEMTPMVR